MDPSASKEAERKPTKAERKAARKRDEIAQANKVLALNNAIEHVDYIAILDFEATCDDTIKPNPQEIIEFPTVLVNTATGEVEATFHTYVRPDVHPTLTAFCTKLTGIQQATVNNGISLQEALEHHETWLKEQGLVPAYDAASGDKKTFVYATCGDWDMKTCLPKQLRYHNKAVPPYLTSWCNLKEAFGDFYKTRPRGMLSMLNHVELELEGNHHSGIDDCRNLARIVHVMLQEGWKPEGITGATLR